MMVSPMIVSPMIVSPMMVSSMMVRYSLKSVNFPTTTTLEFKQTIYSVRTAA